MNLDNAVLHRQLVLKTLESGQVRQLHSVRPPKDLGAAYVARGIEYGIYHKKQIPYKEKRLLAREFLQDHFNNYKSWLSNYLLD